MQRIDGREWINEEKVASTQARGIVALVQRLYGKGGFLPSRRTQSVRLQVIVAAVMTSVSVKLRPLATKNLEEPFKLAPSLSTGSVRSLPLSPCPCNQVEPSMQTLQVCPIRALLGFAKPTIERPFRQRGAVGACLRQSHSPRCARWQLLRCRVPTWNTFTAYAACHFKSLPRLIGSHKITSSPKQSTCTTAPMIKRRACERLMPWLLRAIGSTWSPR